MRHKNEIENFAEDHLLKKPEFALKVIKKQNLTIKEMKCEIVHIKVAYDEAKKRYQKCMKEKQILQENYDNLKQRFSEFDSVIKEIMEYNYKISLSYRLFYVIKNYFPDKLKWAKLLVVPPISWVIVIFFSSIVFLASIIGWEPILNVMSNYISGNTSNSINNISNISSMVRNGIDIHTTDEYNILQKMSVSSWYRNYIFQNETINDIFIYNDNYLNIWLDKSNNNHNILVSDFTNRPKIKDSINFINTSSVIFDSKIPPCMFIVLYNSQFDYTLDFINTKLLVAVNSNKKPTIDILYINFENKTFLVNGQTNVSINTSVNFNYISTYYLFEYIKNAFIFTGQYTYMAECITFNQQLTSNDINSIYNYLKSVHIDRK